ncbi:sugar transferase [Claveliimonas bilis]|uniref:glycosyltransferase family 2 protein n=1 Tax=Claveliimonas bilis TaxID=3028070 RepID=UPI001E2E4F8F|nr:glycosyltransferase family A protein [Claveliimonas bilis]BCZ26294.1 sugar transferase [Claveliimonas bilis]
MEGASKKKMCKKTLTIFTPTYNRGYILQKLYKSLKKQRNIDFQWLIVDDGSTDNTEQIVDTWIKENKIQICYYKQENGGKQRAFNRGVNNAKTELFMCIDSDEYLLEDAVEIILQQWKKIRKNKNLAGMVALRGKTEDQPIGTYFPERIKESSLGELYSSYHFKGDTELIYRTEILKEYPFWVAENEKFMGESYVYQQIDQKYKLFILRKIVAVGEYLQDGYTHNVRRLIKENPISYTELRRQSVIYAKNIKTRFYHTMLCIVGCIMSKQKVFSVAPYKTLAVLAYIPARLVWLIYYKKV